MKLEFFRYATEKTNILLVSSKFFQVFLLKGAILREWRNNWNHNKIWDYGAVSDTTLDKSVVVSNAMKLVQLNATEIWEFEQTKKN